MSVLRVIVACNLYAREYDRLGRATDEYVLAEDDDAAYTDVDDLSGDIVLEEHQTRYDATSGVVGLRLGSSACTATSPPARQPASSIPMLT